MNDLTKQIDDMQVELAQYREHVPLLKQALNAAEAEIATLTRRLDISEHQRALNASRVGTALRALLDCSLIINDIINRTQQLGFVADPAQTPVIPQPAKPEHGGGAKDDGAEIPAFLSNGKPEEAR